MKTLIPTLLITTSLTCFAFLPKSLAVSPPPDGGYPNGNTAEGDSALAGLTGGFYNSAVGFLSLLSNADASFNTGLGAGTLLVNTANENTATGAGALLSNTTGDSNTANGAFALFSNTTGIVNTATGDRALFSNTDGNFNTAVGQQALSANTSGQENTAVGFVALANHPTGNFNTAVGSSALLNTTGAENTGIGKNVLITNTAGNSNTAVGSGALFSSTGSSNIALGQNAGGSVTTASNVICIGASGANVDNSCFIGQIYFNVQPIVGTDPDSVTITSAGRLGRGNVSSRRYKHDVQPMDKASEVIYALKPVSFRYHQKYDATQTLAFGLIAEEVAEVYPDLVGRNPEGQPESVRYEQINAMLLNEFLKEHRKVEELKNGFQATIAQQQKQIEVLTAQLKEQAAQIQKVSAQVEMTKAATRMVLNHP
jgi:Chaperone of endosialidase